MGSDAKTEALVENRPQVGFWRPAADSCVTSTIGRMH